MERCFFDCLEVAQFRAKAVSETHDIETQPACVRHLGRAIRNLGRAIAREDEAFLEEGMQWIVTCL